MARPLTKLIDLTCSNCNSVFQKFPSQIKESKKYVFCNQECVYEHQKKNSYGKLDAICKTCGKEFKFNRAELNKTKGAGSFCSQKCQANGHQILICLFCKIEFKANNSTIKRSNIKFCSKKCYSDKCEENSIEKFFKNISKENHIKNCWMWEGKKDKDGYGIIYSKKKMRAHRLSIELYNKLIPDDLLACHKCNNPSCVNPDHLYIGTHQDNNNDKILHNKMKKLLKTQDI